MANEREQPDAPNSYAELWRRAPWWRAAVIAAGLATVAGLVSWAETGSQSHATPAVAATSENATVAADSASAALASPSAPNQSPSSPATLEPSLADPQRVASVSVPAPSTANLSDEEEQTLATCSPHLLQGSSSMPQIDVNGLAQPNLGHIKVHFWVNGAGVVTHAQETMATYGTAAEQQAELAYLQALRFTVPNTRECRIRQIELIGDVFDQREVSGRWATYVRLYPRLSISSSGALRHAD